MVKIKGQWGDEFVLYIDSDKRYEYRIFPNIKDGVGFVVGKVNKDVNYGNIWFEYLLKNKTWKPKKSDATLNGELKTFKTLNEVIRYLEQ